MTKPIGPFVHVASVGGELCDSSVVTWADDFDATNAPAVVPLGPHVLVTADVIADSIEIQDVDAGTLTLTPTHVQGETSTALDPVTLTTTADLSGMCADLPGAILRDSTGAILRAAGGTECVCDDVPAHSYDPEQTYLVGPAIWTGQVHGPLCDATVTWAQSFTPDAGHDNNPPRVTTAGRHIAVTPPISECSDGPDPVSPGLLTLTPTIWLPSGETRALDPIALRLLIESPPIVQGGQLWGGGLSSNGTVINGVAGTTNIDGLVLVNEDTDWIDVACGSDHVLALKTDGTLWAWGANGSGQLGDGTTDTRLYPTQIGTERAWRAVYAWSNHSYAIASDGSLWGWGSGASYLLAQGADTSNKTTPVLIDSGPCESFGVSDSSASVTKNGVWYTWGNAMGEWGVGHGWWGDKFPNGVGALTQATVYEGWTHQPGDKFTCTGCTPTDYTDWTGAFGNIAIRSNGQLYGYGNPGSQGFKFCTTPWRESENGPVWGETGFAKVAQSDGYRIMAIKEDGTLWIIGGNYGDVVPNSQIGSDSDWADIAGGYAGNYGWILLKDDETLWKVGAIPGQPSGILQIGEDSGWFKIAVSNSFLGCYMAINRNILPSE